MRRFLMVLAAVPLLCVPHLAAAQVSTGVNVPVCDSSYVERGTTGNIAYTTIDAHGNTCSAGPGGGVVVPQPTTAASVTGTTSAVTITNTSAQVAAAAGRTYLSIDNESATATIACRFGGTAAINTAGSYTIPAGSIRVWNSYPIPADALNCISSVASSPATLGVL